LQTTGGRGATIKVTYAEALFDARGKKGDRNLVEGREPKGTTDTFLTDGKRMSFWPLWWRTWRYMQLDVTTTAEPLTLEDLTVNETGYPFAQIGKFKSSDAELDRIWQIGWRTALVDAHETYMDSSFWEQLQYVGDTRLQMLISYAVSGDARLAEQAIDAFAHSHGAGGLSQGAYPSRNSNVIAPFSLLWIGMLDDWRMQQPDKSVIVRNLPRTREILAWFEPWLSSEGLLKKNPEWNFVDWVGQTSQDRTVFPSYSKEGETCLVSAIYLGALQQAAALEEYGGHPAIGRKDAALAQRVATGIQDRCWSADRGLFADNPDQRVFSQQMNALAVLYGVVPKAQGQALLERVVTPGQGIDAPDGMSESSYYFAWYLVRAFEKAGMSDQYHQLLETWRDLLKLNFTTWPEKRGDTRSDTHAWSAHPTADLLGIVAGVQPAALGYSKVRIAPALGHLTSLDAVSMTPKGPVSVSYRLNGRMLIARIVCPPKLSGTFEWHGHRHVLKPGRNLIVVP
jgi:alpha-L-rhamnosidase